jgi:asparagine synthase (glutamine-hydrolysing)
MCGFVVSHSGRSGVPLRQADLDVMDRAIFHRGPDEHGQHVIGPVSMGHRRLSIIDLEGGKQPMASADGRYWLVYNGEIYNFRELRAKLVRLGRTFKEQSDTEVLLHAWQEWGLDCFNRLNGMFALVIYDCERDLLVAARDRFGEKPLYYTEGPGGFHMASELKALVAAGLVEKRLDPVSLYSYFTLGYITGERSIFETVKRLSPGTVLTYSPRAGVETRTWWRPPNPTEEYGDTRSVVWQSLALLQDSVHMRMVSDVPLGFFLSGGLDSSAIVALAAESGAAQLETFSIGFDDPEWDERPYARYVAQRFGTHHHEFVLSPQDFNVIEQIAWHADEPFADQAALPTWFLAKMTREYVTVALSGDGGDEVFAGYDVYRAHGLSERVQSIPPSVRRAAVAGLRASAPFGEGAGRLKLARNIEDAELPAFERFVAKQQTVFRRPFLQSVSACLAGVATEQTDRILFQSMLQNCEHALGDIAIWQQTCGLPDDMLHKVDRIGMAHSLEVRAPFLDHRLVELLNRTKFSVKLPGGHQKHILRKAMSAYFPEDFIRRRKQGFVVPMRRWFKSDLASEVKSLISGRSVTRQIISSAAIERIASEHARGVRLWDGALWALLMFEQWCRAYAISSESLADAA